MSVLLFSNNPRMRAFLPEGCVEADAPKAAAADLMPKAPQSAARPPCPAALLICRLSSGPALPVLLAARDKIHRGWKLLNHPLYGNFRPHQQPYRSLLLKPRAQGGPDADGVSRAAPDAMSLHLLEQALELYSSVPVLDPAKAPAALRDACAILDCELMRLPLQQAGLAPDSLGALA